MKPDCPYVAYTIFHVAKQAKAVFLEKLLIDKQILWAATGLIWKTTFDGSVIYCIFRQQIFVMLIYNVEISYTIILVILLWKWFLLCVQKLLFGYD